MMQLQENARADERTTGKAEGPTGLFYRILPASSSDLKIRLHDRCFPGI